MSAKSFICDYHEWERIFNSKYSLMRHTKSKHLKKKKYECDHWNKKFALQHNLKEHEYIHTQSLPFVWGIDGCTQSFRQRGKLWLHRQKHPTYKKRNYKKNAALNEEGKEEVSSAISQPPMVGVGFQNYNFKYPTSYQGMMSMNAPTQQNILLNQRINNFPIRSNVPRADILNIDMRNLNHVLDYESENSDEEAKEIRQSRDDDLFLNPYSSMFRKLKPSPPSLNMMMSNRDMQIQKPSNMNSSIPGFPMMFKRNDKP